MAVLIVNAGLEGALWPGSTSSGAEVEKYLLEYDPEFAGGRGMVRWTADKAKAKRFDDIVAALAEWKRVPLACPVRAYDGLPNRPLTAYSITFEDS